MEERIKMLEKQVNSIATILQGIVDYQNSVKFKGFSHVVEEVIKKDPEGLKKEIEKSGLKKEIERQEARKERVACIEAHIENETKKDNFQVGLPLSDFTLYKQWVIDTTGNHIGRDVTIFSMPKTSVRIHVSFSE